MRRFDFVLRGFLVALLGLVVSQSPTAASERNWTDRVQISGNADVGFFGGQSSSVTAEDGFRLWDSRLFVDAELAEDVALGSAIAIRNIGSSFEWNLVRNGRLANDVGNAYLDLEGLGESTWANLRVGRFQIPFGEAYKLYSKGYASRTFVHQPVGGPWYWDEGLLVHGANSTSSWGYVASLTNGDSDFNDVGGDLQVSLKLWTQPNRWIYVSASGLWTDDLGPVDGSLWLGEAWSRPFGSGTPPIPNFIDGEAAPNDPEGLGELWAAGLDIVLTPIAGVRIWLAGGYHDIRSSGDSIYDRALTYWIAEVVLEGEVFSSALHPLFVGFRADGLTTGDSDEGYLLDVRYTGQFAYNMESIEAYTGTVGWHLGDYVTLRMEYSHRDVELVRGAAAALGSASSSDVYSAEFGLHF